MPGMSGLGARRKERSEGVRLEQGEVLRAVDLAVHLELEQAPHLHLAEADLLLGEALGRDRLRSHPVAAPLAHLAARRRSARHGIDLRPRPVGLLGAVLVHPSSSYKRSPAPPEVPLPKARALASRSSG